MINFFFIKQQKKNFNREIDKFLFDRATFFVQNNKNNIFYREIDKFPLYDYILPFGN